MVTLLMLALLAAQGPLRVYVFTAPAVLVDEGSKQREDSAKDLREALAKKRLTVVEDRSEADVVLEVLSREQSFDSPSAPRDNRVVTLRVKLTRGDLEAVLASECSGKFQCWRIAANDVAKKVADNAARLKW